MRTGQRYKILRRKSVAGIISDGINDVWESDAVFQFVGQQTPTAVGSGLETQSSDLFSLSGEGNQICRRRIVDATLQSGNKRNVQARLCEVVERLEFDFQQTRLTAQLLHGMIVQCIELQINLQPRAMFRQRIYEFAIMREPDTVGVDHHVIDWLGKCVLDRGEQLRMQSRLASRKLDNFDVTFGRYDRIDLLANFVERFVSFARSAAGVTHWTSQIAAIGDLQYCNAGMLFVFTA